jgi:hypothetical protein
LTANQPENEVKKDKESCYAWGFYSAAIRGEIPKVLSKRNILAWLNTKHKLDKTNKPLLVKRIYEFLKECERSADDGHSG